MTQKEGEMKTSETKPTKILKIKKIINKMAQGIVSYLQETLKLVL